jgi:histidinol-phosphatase
MSTSQLQANEIRELQKMGQQALLHSRKVILNYFQQSVTVEWKADATPVTIADKKAEEVLREFFSKQGGFGFIGEEWGKQRADSSELYWIMDPIDGTKSFIHGVPLFGTLLALYHGNTPILGFIDMPALQSCIWAGHGQGAFLDNMPIQASGVNKIEEALVLSGTLNTIEHKGYEAGWKKLRHSAKLYRGWGDCYGYYLVASGRAEVMFDPVVSVWDVAPMPVIFSECGGKFSTLQGNETILDIQELFTGSEEDTKVKADTLTGLATNHALYSQALLNITGQ